MLTMICCVLQALADGYFFPPTVITGLADNSRCMKDEIFGPVVCLTKVVNILKYGLYRPLFVYFRSFQISIQIQFEKALMLCLGFKPKMA